MRIERIEVEPYELALHWPLRAPDGPLRTRRGFLLRVFGGAGIAGLGEASPAYWLGDESLENARAALDAMRGLAGSDEPLASLPSWRARSPSAACALETACLDLLGRATDRAVVELLGGTPREVAVSALIAAEDPDEIEREAIDLARRGFPALKLKVGRVDLEEDVRGVASVRRACGNGVALRLDANRAWRLDEAQRALAALAVFTPSFVEEPLASGDPEEWRALRDGVHAGSPPAATSTCEGARRGGGVPGASGRDTLPARAGCRAALDRAQVASRHLQPSSLDATPPSAPRRRGWSIAGFAGDVPAEVPLAADESITGLADLRALAATGALDVVVLKAQRLGGPTALLELAREARRLGAAVVVTDSIETSVGRALAAHAAAALDDEPLPIGLGGATLMQGDPLEAAAGGAARARAAGPGLGI